MKRSAAARCTACPPSTEPVKATKSTSGLSIIPSVSSCDRWRYWNTPAGRPAHLPRQLLAELGFLRLHRRDESGDDRLALGELRVAPRALARARRIERRRDLRGLGERALDIHAAVDRGDGAEGRGHVSSL